MNLDDITISRLIIQSFTEKLTSLLDVDVAMVGAGPSNLTAGHYLGKAGVKAVILESKLAPGGGMWGGGMMFNEAVLQEDAVQSAEKTMDMICEAHLGGYTKIQKKVVSGDPATEILKIIESEDIDMIVMGTRGRTDIEQVLMGSVTEKVAKKSHVPVLTVNPYGIK